MYGIVDNVNGAGDEVTVESINGTYTKVTIPNEARISKRLFVGAVVWFASSSTMLDTIVCLDTRDCIHGAGSGNRGKNPNKRNYISIP